jgi:hypothetical protein
VPGTQVPPGATVQQLLAQANLDVGNAQAALAQQNLGAYESYVRAATAAIKEANSLPPGGTTPASTTTVPPAKGGPATSTTSAPKG